MSVPELTPQARAAAAARGVAARRLRAEVRRELNTGDAKIRDVLLAGQLRDDRGRILARMRVVDLLSSFRGIGPIRAADIMERIGIASNRRIGGLGERQVAELSDLIERRYAEAPEEPEAVAGPAAGPVAGTASGPAAGPPAGSRQGPVPGRPAAGVPGRALPPGRPGALPARDVRVPGLQRRPGPPGFRG